MRDHRQIPAADLADLSFGQGHPGTQEIIGAPPVLLPDFPHLALLRGGATGRARYEAYLDASWSVLRPARNTPALRRRQAERLLDLRQRKRDVRGYVHAVEGWVIAALGELGIEAFRAEGRIGIWTIDQTGREAKIGAIGVRIRQWVTMHGFAVNLSPNLGDFNGIVPCGIAEFPVTSAAALGKPVTSRQFDSALHATFLPFLDALT